MSIVISNSMVLSTELIGIQPNAGVLAWQSIVTETNVTASSELETNPVTNLANPATVFTWQAANTDEQTIEVEVEQSIDYIGIARHNLSGSAEIRIQAGVNGDYYNLTGWEKPDDRQALLFLINEAEPDSVRIRIRNNIDPPVIGVLYVGLAMRLERNIYVGHTPITMGRDVQTVGGYSESGQYLGELIRREGRSTSVSLQNLTPQWYRDNLDAFIRRRPRKPAFFAWRPGKYPAEVGYVWIKGSPRPSNQRPNGMMQIDIQFEGIA